MSLPDTSGTTLPAVAIGRVCAVAGRAQREAREWAARYEGLFGAKPFDATLFNTVCLCTAFSAPWLDAAELRMTNRVAVWSFGADWLIDYVATSRAEVRDVVARCLAVADGAPAPDGDDLARALAGIRDDLASSAAFPALRDVWREELHRFLTAMAVEWDWNAARGDGPAPAFADYLNNTDNLGFSFAFVSHWAATAEPPPAEDVPAILAASREAQRTMRLINDLGTYERDLSWGDLNALMLGVTERDVREHLAVIGTRFRTLLEPLRAAHPRLAAYMERQVDFCEGFQELTDYWGTL
ncbi:terpene synthase family protein [Actinoallomurus spadix]|uniref:Terpene synthase n=1 Tax=Actinoallomurus spadix TaxID=79912 RepID=A0ABP3GRU1_9ACTN|nr:terpene synthase family protein [Actinoallomurus spadix]MCO5989037.1 terpene synthase family protein [Actinoallomurus spadix]